MEQNQNGYFDKKYYKLKLYDTTLLTFSMGYDIDVLGEKRTVIDDINVLSNHTSLFPYNMPLSADGVLTWLQKRSIPKHRQFVDEILASVGLSHSDVKGLVDISKALSLNDSYWVVPDGFSGKFTDFNLYENSFDEILGLIAYTGYRQSHKILSTSPEFTTGGMLAKAWRREQDGIYLYKSGTEGYANSGMEPYSEFFASQVAKRMGLDAVEYSLSRWKGRLVSKCRLFSDINTSFVPMGDIVPSCDVVECLDFCTALGDKIGQDARSMFVFDSLIFQEDRHFGNFGLMRDNSTGEFLRFAPVFDNGISLLNFAMDSDMKDEASTEAYAATRTPVFKGYTFGQLAAVCMTKVQHEQLRRLIGFTFVNDNLHPMAGMRVKQLEKLLRKRVSLLLNIPLRQILPDGNI